MNGDSTFVQNVSIKKQERDGSVDLLRFVALTCIILAHVNVSPLWMQIRNFDVPLMVFLSGVSFRLSGSNSVGYHLRYVWNRFKRLVLPTWIFLSIYCAVHWLTDGQTLPLRTVISYYSFMTPWFVWIIRVFFLIALMAQPISVMAERLSMRTFLVVVIASLSLFEIYLASSYSHFRGSTYLLMNISYAIVFAFGYKIPEFRNIQTTMLSLASLIVYACLLVYYSASRGGVFAIRRCLNILHEYSICLMPWP